MFRFSLIIGVSLIICVTARPHKTLNKFKDETFQDTVMSVDKEGKISWGVEVEPPEDLDETHYDVDPNMKIWQSMTGGRKDKHLKAEEDLDELYHPSLDNLLKVEIQNMVDLPGGDVKVEVMQAEEDKDDVDHPDFKVGLEEPEQDMDVVYHKAVEEVNRYLAPLKAEYRADAEVRPLYSEPEKDMDEVYHRDPAQVVYYPAVAQVDLPSQRKHSKPEEDLDHIYHP